MARFIIVGMLMIAAIAGARLYYQQVFAYYTPVQAEAQDVRLTNLVTGQAEPILFDGFEGIDADSSPIRYRACFTTPLSQAMLTETFIIRDDAEPLVAPSWFDCFDAVQIGADIESGEAIAFLGVENVQYGIDRLVAIYPDGRAGFNAA